MKRILVTTVIAVPLLAAVILVANNRMFGGNTTVLAAPKFDTNQFDQATRHVMSVAQSAQYKQALVAIDTDPQAQNDAAADINSFLKKKGVQIDPDTQAEFKKAGADPSICLSYRGVSLCYSWN